MKKILLVALLLLASCNVPAPEGEERDHPKIGDQVSSSAGPVVPQSLSLPNLTNLTYTLVDASVRASLAKVGVNFRFRLQDGQAIFPSSVSALGYARVHADTAHVTYGDLNHDGIPDAVVPLFIDRKDDAILELAAVTDSGSTPVHFASFPIGVAALQSLSVTDNKIRVNFIHQVPGDPGPRNTELVLELPKNQ